VGQVTWYCVVQTLPRQQRRRRDHSKPVKCLYVVLPCHPERAVAGRSLSRPSGSRCWWCISRRQPAGMKASMRSTATIGWAWSTLTVGYVVIQNRIYRYRCQLLASSGINLSQILSSSLPVTNRLMVILSYGVNSTEGLASLSDIRFMKRMSCESDRYLFASHVRIQLCVSLWLLSILSFSATAICQQLSTMSVCRHHIGAVSITACCQCC